MANISISKADSAYFKQTLLLRERIAQAFVGQVQKSIAKMVAPVINNLERTNTLDNMDHIINASYQDTEQFLILLKRMYIVSGITYGQFMLDTFNGSSKALKTKGEINVVEPDYYTQTDESFFRRAMSDFAESVGADKVVNISETNRSILRSIVKAAGENGWSAKETAKHMVSFFSGDLSAARALMIARTEVMTSSSFAGNLTGEQIEKAGIKLKKQWLPTALGKYRPTHLAMAAKKPVLFTDLFQVGNQLMKHPHDPSAPASEVINCRCSIRYIPI